MLTDSTASKTSVQDYNVYDVLLTQLDKSQREYPERYRLPVRVQPAVDEHEEHAWLSSLSQAKHLTQSECIVLVPYNVGGQHWVGLSIKLNEKGEVEEAELADPIAESSFPLDKLQEEFVRVFQVTFKQAENVLRSQQPAYSARLTAKNLLQAAERMQPSSPQDEQQGNRFICAENELCDNSAASDVVQSDSSTEYLVNWQSHDEMQPSDDTVVSQTLASEDTVLSQLKQKLLDGFTKWKIDDTAQLREEMDTVRKQIDRHERLGKMKEAEKEKRDLEELAQLLSLSEQVDALQQSAEVEQSEVDQLEAQLRLGLEKWKLNDEDQLREEIEFVQMQVVRYERRGQMADADREREGLSELKELLAVAEQIRTLRQSPENIAATLLKLDRKLKEGLAKWEINDVAGLPDEIEITKRNLERYQRLTRVAAAEEESDTLRELLDLQKLSEEINALQQPSGEEVSTTDSRASTSSGALPKSNHTEMPVQKETPDTSKAPNDRCTGLAEEQIDGEQKPVSRLEGSQDDHTPRVSNSTETTKLTELEQVLAAGLLQWNVAHLSQLPTVIERVQQNITQLTGARKMDEVRRETLCLNELLTLQTVCDELDELRRPVFSSQEYSVQSDNRRRDHTVPYSLNNRCEPQTPEKNRPSQVTIPYARTGRKNEELKDLRQDIESMPVCAERMILELIESFGKKTLSDSSSNGDTTSELQSFEKLKDQLAREEHFSGEIRKQLDELYRNIHSHNWTLGIRDLSEVLKRIRPLNVSEIKRLVERTRVAATLIRDKDIVLLLGVTGSGKSTTIQFLAGAPMAKVNFEVEPGLFLEHITADGPINNPELKGVTTSPLSRSETRFIHSVRVDLRKVIGAHASGEIIFCDAPGFGDTAGPEVDIANGVGVIEALKGCKSVKILALSSYKSVGDRGQGIQKLAHMLVKMIPDIQKRLGSIFYGFTKYPVREDIHAFLTEIKRSTVDQDPLLKIDSGLITVLSDMIKKTKAGGEKIDPITHNPADLLEKLLQVDGISYPGEAFHFSMSEETQGCIANQVQLTKSGVACAAKNRNVKLIEFCLKRLKFLRDLLDVSEARDAYEDAVRIVNGCIANYCSDVMRQFNRALRSHDGLQAEDVASYENAIDYLTDVQSLREYLGLELASSESFVKNAESEIRNRSKESLAHDLASPLIGVCFDNHRLLIRFSEQLALDYTDNCKQLAVRVGQLRQLAEETIRLHDFHGAAEQILTLSKCAQNFGTHVEKVDAKYVETVQFLLKHLQSFTDKVTPILARPELDDSAIGTIAKYVETLKAAKENPALQERVLVFIETQQKQRTNDITGIYDAFVDKVVRYAEEKSKVIKDRLEKNERYAVQHIERIVNNMEAILGIPELELRTAKVYYRTVEHINAYMQRLQMEAEHVLSRLNQDPWSVNYPRLARHLWRLKNAKWIARVTPEAHESLIQHIADELTERVHRLEESSRNLDLNLKCTENVAKARIIVESAEKMRVLEGCLPELTAPIDRITERFTRCVTVALDQIQAMFQLQDNAIYRIKLELAQLEAIRREYDNHHPSRIYLKEQDYERIELVNDDIAKLEKLRDQELEEAAVREGELRATERKWSQLLEEYETLTSSDRGLKKAVSAASTMIFRSESAMDKLLRENGFRTIDEIHGAICDTQAALNSEAQSKKSSLDKRDAAIGRLRTIQREYERQVSSQLTPSEQQSSLLQHHQQDSVESLDSAIEGKRHKIEQSARRQQTYSFGDRFDAASANSALGYIDECKQISIDNVRETATETRTLLEKYLNEYARSLNLQIDEAYRQITAASVANDSAQLAYRLESYMQLFSLKKFPTLYTSIHGEEKVSQWREKFVEYHRQLGTDMERYHVTGNIQKLKDCLDIAYQLSCLDRFCGDHFGQTGFDALYSKYNSEIAKSTQQATCNVLGHISKEDYDKVDTTLLEIVLPSVHTRDLAQIKLDLQRSLNKLMKDTEDSANFLSGQIERGAQCKSEIDIIKGNIDRIRTAVMKQRILDLLDENTRERLRRFDEHIDDILSTVVSKALESVESFMGVDGFAEAEQGLKNISPVIDQLSRYCTSAGITAKSTDLRKKLDGIVKDIATGRNFDNISKYSENSPKNVLDKLKDASLGDVRYEHAYQSALGKIRQAFRKKIEETRFAEVIERPKRMRELHSALYFLPEPPQAELKKEVDAVQCVFTEEEQTCKRNLEKTLSLSGNDEQKIHEIRALLSRFQEEKNTIFSKQLSDEVLKSLDTDRNNVALHLKEQEMPLALDILKNVFKYRVVLRSLLPKVEAMYDSVYALLIDAVQTYCDTLMSVSTLEQASAVESAVKNILAFVSFSHTFDSQTQQLVTDDGRARISAALNELHKYLREISQLFSDALSSMNISSLSQAMASAKRWDELIQSIRKGCVQNTLFRSCFPDLSAIKCHADMVSPVEKHIVNLKKQLDVDLMNDQTERFEDARNRLFLEITNAISTLREISKQLKDFLSSPVDVETPVNRLKANIQVLGERLLAVTERKNLNERDCDEFRKLYNHLVSIDKYLRIDEDRVKRYLTVSEDRIFAQVASLSKEFEKPALRIEEVARLLIATKFLAENLSMFDTKINAQIDEMLTKYKSMVNRLTIVELTMILEKTDIGSRLIAEHSALSGEDWRKRREKMQNQDNLEYALGQLHGDDIVKDALCARHETFKKVYHNLVDANLPKQNQTTRSKPNLDSLKSALKLLLEKVIPPSPSIEWTQAFKDKIPEIVAYIFAVWTLTNTQHYNASRGIEDGQAYLLMPHVGQVLAIFRILGLGYSKPVTVLGCEVPLIKRTPRNLFNNLVQVGTGEGKSVIMAVTACVFALTGVDVSCSCYSEVLTMRDKADFARVFQILGVSERIAYGTFNKLCEDLLNEQCTIREKVREMILSNSKSIAEMETKARMRPRVLLIDEVDVFLSEQYYGGVYTPAVHLKDASIKALLDAVWEKNTVYNLRSVQAFPAYVECANRFSNWIFLFDEAIKDMLAARKSFETATYAVQNDRIGYIVGESIVENVVRGYDTIWAYYKEYTKGNITLTSLEQNVGIIINCGAFSYAEMPHEYAYIAGVTGTLETLAAPEKKILRDVYTINKSTYMPSVFGKSNRNYNSMNDVHAVNESEYYTRIRGEIDMMCRAKRAILVFFESEAKLLAFYESKMLQSIRDSVQIITERVAPKERELAIKRAASEGRATLLTRTFGRGTDFICRSQNLLANGGVHVLQTFFSQELSEECQIMGRSARQGEQGSYRMVLLDSDLEWVIGSNWKEEISKITGSTLYETLNGKRNALYEGRCGAKALGIVQCKEGHETSIGFLRALAAGQMHTVKQFLLEQNRGANLTAGSSRTIVLMDATGSMSPLLSAAKDTVCTMFERATTILERQSIPSDMFQVQFVVYRDYDCKADRILQCSSWEAKPANLRSFMTTVTATGGGDYEEAIEIGLWHAVQESEQPEGVSQVILIGDAPAKDLEAIIRDRRSAGGEAYWKATKYQAPTHYSTELQKLKEKNIPVHAFYLNDGAKGNFEEIAKKTEGRCKFLNIHSSDGAELLTNFVTEEVLRKAAGDHGDDAVVLYRKTYGKIVYTS